MLTSPPCSPPPDPKLSGTARAATSVAAIPTSRSTRGSVSPVGSVLVSHAYAPHAHHSMAKTSTAWASPRAVGSWDTSHVICVMANTKTRSKNSSSVETAVSSSASSFGASGRGSGSGPAGSDMGPKCAVPTPLRSPDIQSE